MYARKNDLRGAWVNHEPWGKPSGEGNMHNPVTCKKGSNEKVIY